MCVYRGVCVDVHICTHMGVCVCVCEEHTQSWTLCALYRVVKCLHIKQTHTHTHMRIHTNASHPTSLCGGDAAGRGRGRPQQFR
jgi:hypothetical protein